MSGTRADSRLFDLEAHAVHALEFVRRQVHDEACGEVVQHARERQAPKRRLLRESRHGDGGLGYLR